MKIKISCKFCDHEWQVDPKDLYIEKKTTYLASDGKSAIYFVQCPNCKMPQKIVVSDDKQVNK